MSALFNFDSFCVAVLLAICTCTYLKQYGKGDIFRRQHRGLRKFGYKCFVIGGGAPAPL
eukprot:gene35360-7860_t